MTKYEIIFEALQDKVNSGELTIEEAELINDMAFNKYIEFTEAESDHPQHMRLKYDAAKQLKKEPDELKNKKYKTAESGKKADLRYQYRYGKQKNKRTITDYDAKYNATSYETKGDIKPSDIKELEYMQKHSDLSNPEEAKKYKTAFRMFCNKYGIDENSSLYIRYSPKEYGNKMYMAEWPDSKKLTKKELQKPKKSILKLKENEHKFILPSGYMLIHRSSVPNLTELKPTKYTDHYMKKGSSGLGGQYHSTGRVYFVLSKTLNPDTKGMGRGKYLYKLTSNISGFYLDYEGIPNHSADRYPDISTLVGKPVYVKTDVPLKVKKLIGTYDKDGRYKEQ